ncbi:hypothetical protein ACLMJK_005568 [Lecanora helva]
MPPPKVPSLTLLRSFSTTYPSRKATTELFQNKIPPYPYGPSLNFKQANTGLYGGSTIQFGNIVSKQNAIKTRRTWHPNIHHKRLWSDALQKFVAVKVQARVLRTIDKVGGLDEYLLGNRPARIKELGVAGWRLRWEVMQTEKVQARLREERARLGLPAEGWKEPLPVEEEVERVTGDVVDQIEVGREGEEDPLTEREEFEDEIQEESQYDGGSTQDSRFDRDGGRPVESRDGSGKAMKIPRLVSIAEPKAEEQEGNAERTEQGIKTEESQDVVQANDSQTAAGKAVGKLRGIFRR